MIYLAITIATLFGLLAAVSGLLAGGAGPASRIKGFEFLKIFDGKQGHLTVVALVSLVVAYGAGMWKDVLGAKPSVQVVEGPNGDPATKATIKSFLTETAEASESAKQPAQDHFARAEGLIQQGKYGEAAEQYRESVESLPTLSGYLNYALSLAYSNPYEAERVYQVGLKLAREKGDKRWEAMFIGNLARLAQDTGNREKALKGYQDALAISREINDPWLQGVSYHNVGSMEAEDGQWDKARASYSEAIRFYRQSNADLAAASAMGSIGVSYMEEGKPDQALPQFEAALRVFEAAEDSGGQATAWHDIGNALLESGRAEEAIDAFNKSLALDRRFMYLPGQFQSLVRIGDASIRAGRPDDALSPYDGALRLQETFNVPPDAVAITLWKMGNLLVHLGRAQAGLPVLAQARDLYAQIGLHAPARDIDATIQQVMQSVASMPQPQ
jgi:tetratricopeptide (TPR) repeat protein